MPLCLFGTKISPKKKHLTPAWFYSGGIICQVPGPRSWAMGSIKPFSHRFVKIFRQLFQPSLESGNGGELWRSRSNANAFSNSRVLSGFGKTRNVLTTLPWLIPIAGISMKKRRIFFIFVCLKVKKRETGCWDRSGEVRKISKKV